MLERFDEAMSQADEAVTIYRRLAADHLDTVAPDLAGALYDYAVALDGAHRRREVLAAVTEAVDICSTLNSDDPGRDDDDYGDTDEKAVRLQRRLLT